VRPVNDQRRLQLQIRRPLLQRLSGHGAAGKDAFLRSEPLFIQRIGGC